MTKHQLELLAEAKDGIDVNKHFSDMEFRYLMQNRYIGAESLEETVYHLTVKGIEALEYYSRKERIYNVQSTKEENCNHKPTDRTFDGVKTFGKGFIGAFGGWVFNYVVKNFSAISEFFRSAFDIIINFLTHK